jgi:hypothetical protein
MTQPDFDHELLCLSMTAGMNQRYHQKRAHFWTCWNRGVQISVAVLAVTGVCLSVVTYFVEAKIADWFGIGVATSAAIAAIALNVLPLGDWAAMHLDLFRRWTDLREDVDSLKLETAAEPSKYGVQRLRELGAKVHRICATEPAPKEKLLHECHNAEKRSRKTENELCETAA